MKVGDYVRTKSGKIVKCFKSESMNKPIYYVIGSATNSYIEYQDVIKSSPNIIDLIAVGDIITFKDDEDVYKVIGIPNKECALEVFYLAKNYDGNTEDIMVYPDEMKKYIKSIVTKEQFESMKYEVE